MDPTKQTEITDILDGEADAQGDRYDPIVLDPAEYMMVLDYFQAFGHDTGPNKVGNVPNLSWRGHRIDVEPQ